MEDIQHYSRTTGAATVKPRRRGLLRVVIYEFILKADRHPRQKYKVMYKE
jgi:hypothetical protein